MIYRLTKTIWAGSYPTQEEVDYVIKKGVKLIIDLTRWDEWLLHSLTRYKVNGAKRENLPMWSRRLPKAPVLVYVAEKVILTPSFIHCRHGLDRTGVVATTVLMVSKGLTAEAAIKEVTRKRGQQSPRKPYHLSLFEERIPAAVEDYLVSRSLVA